MSFSYDFNLITDLDRFRFRLDDTVESGCEFQDEEINALITYEGGLLPALISACYKLYSKYSKKIPKLTIGHTQLDRTRTAERYLDLANKFKEEIENANTGVPIVFFGGISKAERELNTSNDDLISIDIKEDFMDNKYGD